MGRGTLETLETIKTRRSIRKYKKEIISDDILKELLEAGMSGPTGGDNKPWEFIVINDPEILREIPNAPLELLLLLMLL